MKKLILLTLILTSFQGQAFCPKINQTFICNKDAPLFSDTNELSINFNEKENKYLLEVEELKLIYNVNAWTPATFINGETDESVKVKAECLNNEVKLIDKDELGNRSELSVANQNNAYVISLNLSGAIFSLNCHVKP